MKPKNKLKPIRPELDIVSLFIIPYFPLLLNIPLIPVVLVKEAEAEVEITGSIRDGGQKDGQVSDGKERKYRIMKD